MATIVTRAGKGSPLTHNEVDANFNNLNTDKAELNSPTFTGTVSLPTSTSIGNVSSTEIGYLDGVTSAIQTQLNAKGVGSVTSVGGTGSVNGITLSGTVTSSGNLTLGGTLSGVSLTTQVTGTLPIANGGTNATTASTARSNLLPSYTSNGGKVLAVNTGATDVEWINAGGTGTVTTVSVVSANGFAGTVANASTTPAITLSTSITGLLKGNGTAISAASSGTDYAPATSGTSILYGNGSGGFSNVTVGTGLSFTGGTLSATGGGGTMIYPGAGIAVSTGSAWDTSLTAPTGTVVGTSDTQTLTNKRITPRVSTTTSSATPTINTDNVDFYGLTAQAVDITSFTTNLSGTPTDGQKLWIYIVGTAARAITWGASFESSTATLPTTTVSTNRLDVGFVWNAATSKWRCVAVA